MEYLNKTVKAITSLDQSLMNCTEKRLNNLTKPPGSLGRLEDLVIKISGITGEKYPVIKDKYHLVMAADHGVAAEGVSAFPQEVTTQMVYNFIQGGAAVNVLANKADTDLKIVDMGIKNKINKKMVATEACQDRFIEKRIKSGTDNIVKGPAMSGKEAVASLETGIEITEKIINKGVDIIGTGEMGIANTTPSTAIVALITNSSLEEIVGYGTGIDDKTLKHKREIIARAIEINQPDPENGIDLLAKIGGLEIGGMAGIMLAAAAGKVPVIIDGLISAAAALIAYKIEPQVKDYLIASHRSVEPAHEKIYNFLDLEPMLDMNMRLGEGTGAVLAMNLVESACKILSEMATFDDLAKFNQDDKNEIS